MTLGAGRLHPGRVNDSPATPHPDAILSSHVGVTFPCPSAEFLLPLLSTFSSLTLHFLCAASFLLSLAFLLFAVSSSVSFYALQKLPSLLPPAGPSPCRCRQDQEDAFPAPQLLFHVGR